MTTRAPHKEVPRPTFDREKFKELLLYIVDKAEDHPGFGDTHLNKTLVYSEWLAYQSLGRPITGERVQRMEFGPTSKPLIPIRKEMCEQGELLLRPADKAAFRPARTLAQRKPNLSKFTPDEIAIIDRVFEFFAPKTAGGTSRFSHDFVWEFFDIKEEIPYGMVFFGSHEFTDAEIEYAKKLEVEARG